MSVSTSSLQEVILAIQENVATITLNRPTRGNAITPRLGAELVAVLDDIEKNSDIRVVILTGAGKYFCTGMDLGSNTKQQGDLTLSSDDVVKIFRRLRDFPKPTIARVNGPALGGGVGFVFACDFRFACASHVYFAFTEVKRGIVPAVISTFIVPQMGVYTANQYMLSGAPFPAEEAYRLNLLTKVCASAEEADTQIHKCVQELLSSAPGAMAVVKGLVQYVGTHSDEEGTKYAQNVFKAMMKSEEAKFGIDAFKRKEKPDWTSFVAMRKSKL